MSYLYPNDGLETKALEKIDYAKRLYEAQVLKAEKEEYIKNLLLGDYIAKIREHRTRYDFIDFFGKAQAEVGKRLKKDRPHLESLTSFIMEDFLNNDKKFKLTKIVSCGYEGYAWKLEFTGYGKTIFIEIPVKSRLTTENIEYANDGMYAFGVYESEYYMSVRKRSHVPKVIAEAIKEYFANDEKGVEDAGQE